MPFTRAFNEGLRFFNFPRGSRQTILYCAHRATTALSWGLCEQEERSACSLASSEAVRCAARKIIGLYITPLSMLSF